MQYFLRGKDGCRHVQYVPRTRLKLSSISGSQEQLALLTRLVRECQRILRKLNRRAKCMSCFDRPVSSARSRSREDMISRAVAKKCYLFTQIVSRRRNPDGFANPASTGHARKTSAQHHCLAAANSMPDQAAFSEQTL